MNQILLSIRDNKISLYLRGVLLQNNYKKKLT